MVSVKVKKSKEGYSSLQGSPLRELTYHMGSHSVTCHPAEVTFPPLPVGLRSKLLLLFLLHKLSVFIVMLHRNVFYDLCTF